MHSIHLGWIPQTIYTGAELGNDSVETLIMKKNTTRNTTRGKYCISFIHFYGSQQIEYTIHKDLLAHPLGYVVKEILPIDPNKNRP